MRVLALAACALGEPQVHLAADPGGLEVAADRPLTRVEVLAADRPLATRRLPAPVDQVRVEVPWEAGTTHRVRLSFADGTTTERTWTSPAVLPAVRLEVEVPAGASPPLVDPVGEVPVLLVGGGVTTVRVRARAWRTGDVELTWGEQRVEAWLAAGSAVALDHAVHEPSTVAVRSADGQRELRVSPHAVSTAEIAARLIVVGDVFPAEASGTADLARPAGRVTVQAPWWEATLAAAGMGFRPRDRWSPWAWQALTLENRGPDDLDVAVQARVLLEGSAGLLPDPAFAARLRGADAPDGAVRVLVRVPAGARATAVLPFFVDEDRLPVATRWRELTVAVLGSPEPVHVSRRPLYVSRGSPLAAGVVVVALLAALAGAVGVFRGARPWLAAQPTSLLMTVALFGALTFTVGVVGQLAGLAVGALLGPFSVLLTAAFDDTLRTALLACLLTLLPRQGVAASTVLVGWLLSGLALGGLSPVDLVFVGARVFWLEAALWAAGVTRGRPGARRLALALTAASLASSAGALALHVVLYRLFWAPWYVAMVLVGPAGLYVLVACRLAAPLAASLRRVAA